MKMNFHLIPLTTCVAVTFCSPIELEDKLRKLFADEKELSLKGLGVSTRGIGTGSSLYKPERKIIIQLHREARKNVQPPASNMQKMNWSKQLTTEAQTYADKCIWAHNKERSSQASSFSYVGENLFVTTSAIRTGNPGKTCSSEYLERGVAKWVSEKKDYDYVSNSCSGTCAHYTQVVRFNNIKLGCAVGSCPTMTNLPSNFKNVKFIVCNYGRRGDFNGPQPYEEA